MNSLDVFLQNVCPCIMCPRHEPLVLLEEDAHRFLVGDDGLYMEVRRPWIHAIFQVAHTQVPMPYGKPPALALLALPRETLSDALWRFIRTARSRAPNEYAAWLTFVPQENEIGYVEPVEIGSSSHHVQYYRPSASRDCLPVVDCHSHGHAPAFFSPTDDADDIHDDLKIAFVVGNLNTVSPSFAMRLTGLGLTVDLSERCGALLYPGSRIATSPEISGHER